MLKVFASFRKIFFQAWSVFTSMQNCLHVKPTVKKAMKHIVLCAIQQRWEWMLWKSHFGSRWLHGAFCSTWGGCCAAQVLTSVKSSFFPCLLDWDNCKFLGVEHALWQALGVGCQECRAQGLCSWLKGLNRHYRVLIREGRGVEANLALSLYLETLVTGNRSELIQLRNGGVGWLKPGKGFWGETC